MNLRHYFSQLVEFCCGGGKLTYLTNVHPGAILEVRCRRKCESDNRAPPSSLLLTRLDLGVSIDGTIPTEMYVHFRNHRSIVTVARFA
jgi:hypothetical protein